MGRNKGLLLDRDGVINVDTGYVHTREAFHFRPGVLPFLRNATDRGFRLAIVTNQAGVARGLYAEEDHRSLMAWVAETFQREGIGAPLMLACYTHPKGVVPAYARASYWRKPSPGMLLEAALRLDLDLGRSAMVGDSKKDMQAALQAGVAQAFWLTEAGEDLGPGVTRVKDFDRIWASMTAFEGSASGSWPT